VTRSLPDLVLSSVVDQDPDPAFKENSDPVPGPGFEKNTAEKKIYFFDQKLQLAYS
jgi:hypothetical protein